MEKNNIKKAIETIIFISERPVSSKRLLQVFQDLKRIEIDEIRGVDSSGVIGLLLEKRLTEIKGRKEVIGRPFLYGTTEVFLEAFGLKSLADLPTLKELVEIEKSLEESVKVY